MAQKKEETEIVKMSELPAKKEEKTRVIVMDKKLLRKIRPGEEEKLEEVAKEAGVEEVDLGLEEPSASRRDATCPITAEAPHGRGRFRGEKPFLSFPWQSPPLPLGRSTHRR